MTDAARNLHKYRIIEEIGRGGFAIVYRAEDTTLGREVALKVLHPPLLTESDLFERFEREAKTMATLEHPHIATVHEVGEAEGWAYIAMELAHRGNLADRIAEQGPIPWEESLALLEPICEALDFAHAEGLIHRDLKPSNVLLDPKKGVLLTDFGLARFVDDSSLSTKDNIKGTLAYVAPEVWDGQPSGQASDIYALGCILHEMITGEKAFQGDSPIGSMKAHSKPLELPERWPDGVPAGIEKVLHKALAKEPADRYGCAGEMLTELKDIAKAAQSGRAAKRRPADRTRLQVAIVALTVILCGVIVLLGRGAWALWGDGDSFPAWILGDTSTPTSTAWSTPVPTATATLSEAPTRTPRPLSTPSSTPTRTSRPTSTPSPTLTRTPRPTSTSSPTPTRTPFPTRTPRPTPTYTPILVEMSTPTPVSMSEAEFVAMGSRILQIVNGSVWAYSVSEDHMDSGDRLLTYDPVASKPEDRHILAMDDRILVINVDGEVWYHIISESLVGPAQRLQLSRNLVASQPTDQYVLAVGDRILVINTEGDVWAHDVSSHSVGEAVLLEGSSYTTSVRERYVVAMDDRILIITAWGAVWAQDVFEDRVGEVYEMEGDYPVADQAVDKHVLVMDDRILVINDSGDVWAHDIDVSENRVGRQYRLDGSIVAH